MKHFDGFFCKTTGVRSDFLIERSWRKRLCAIGKFLAFVAFFFVLLMLFGWLAARLIPPLHGLVWQALAGNLQVLLATILVTFVLARLDGYSLWRFGLGGNRRWPHFLLGAGCGFVLLFAVLWVFKLSGGFSFGSCTTTGWSALTYALAYGALFLTVALSEEILWRGYALVNLSKAVSFWPALILISTLFGLRHLHHGQENILGILSVGIYSLVLGYSFLRFGSLWFAIGLHAAWDYAQSFIFGVPDSGVIVPGSIMIPVFSGRPWLTGGSAGPEGSPLMIIIFALLVLVIRKASPAPASMTSP